MWLLRRKATPEENAGDVLPPVAAPMRRIEITVERHSISRLVSGTVSDETVPDTSWTAKKALNKPPDS